MWDGQAPTFKSKANQFYQLLETAVKRYINICLFVFFFSTSDFSDLIEGIIVLHNKI